jgi:hypothetical protein
MMKGSKSIYCEDTFRPFVIMILGYLTHKKMCEVVIYEYVHDRKLLHYIQGEVM